MGRGGILAKTNVPCGGGKGEGGGELKNEQGRARGKVGQSSGIFSERTF